MDKPKDKDKDKPRDSAPDTDLTAEIRRDRKFSMAEAVGREAAGSLKGASPVAPTQQLALQIEELLERRLHDNEGSLGRTIAALLADNTPLLDQHLDDPAGALLVFLDKVLNTPSNLDTLVRQVDAQWGRDYDERPYFEKQGQAASPDDPYTRDSVRALLTELRRSLTT